MKRRILITILKSGKNRNRLSILFLCIILSINLSGQNVQTMLLETWTTGNWQKSMQQINTYDGSGYLINTLSQTWDVPSTSWKDFFKTVYTNNSNGTPNQSITQSWDGASWNNSLRSTYTYNASKKVLTEIREMWLGTWQNSGKEINTYNGSGYLTNSLYQTWDFISTSWKNNEQINYTNNSNGYPTQEITQLWDGVSAWINSERSTYTYNTSNKELTEVTDKWVSGAWKADSRVTNTYNGSGYWTNSLSQIWDSGSSSWKNDTQLNFTNNADGTPSVVISQEWDGVSAWNNFTRQTYTYSSPTHITEFFSEESITLYPNPAHDFVRIAANKSMRGLTYSITDQTGKLVMKGKLINENPAIDISTLTNGIYFLHLGEKSRHSYKIIKNDIR